jgi:hypothetical protein
VQYALHGVISGMTAGDAYATESSQEIGMKRRDHVLHTLLSGFASSALSFFPLILF